MPIEAAPVLTYSNDHLVAVAATSTHDYTVAFLGTSDGRIKKAVVETVTNAFEYSDEAIVPDSRIGADLHFDQSKNFLYVMTDKRVTLMRVQNCQQHKTCGECLGARDPYCGWCSLENKCSLRSDCAEAAQDPLYWLLLQKWQMHYHHSCPSTSDPKNYCPDLKSADRQPASPRGQFLLCIHCGFQDTHDERDAITERNQLCHAPDGCAAFHPRRST